MTKIELNLNIDKLLSDMVEHLNKLHLIVKQYIESEELIFTIHSVPNYI